MKAIIVNNQGHMSPLLNELLWNINEAILILNPKEHIVIKNSPKIYELIRASIFEWMKEHGEMETKLNPISNRLSRYIAETLEEWLALNDIISMSVNFHQNLVEIGKEAKYLDRLGFDICDSAMKVFLQESKFTQTVDRLNAMLQTYQQVVEPLQFFERCAVRKSFKQLYQTLRPAFLHLNWNSLGISHFIDSCVKGIQDFNVSFQIILCVFFLIF